MRVARRWPAGRLAAAGVLLALLALAATAQAHVVVGTRSLHLRVAQADLVLRATIVDPEVPFVLPDGAGRRSLVEARGVEILKGSLSEPTLRFVQHGPGVAEYAAGDEALLFLEEIGRSRELRAMAVPGGPSHVSSQEQDEAFRLAPPHGETLVEATRMLIDSERAPTPDARLALVRRATIDLLTTGDAQLGAAALSTLVVAHDAELVTPEDLPRLEKLLADSAVSIGLRAGVLAELERRGLVGGPPRWLALLDGATPAQLPAAIRAAGAHPSAPVQARLIATLRSDDVRIAAEAAMALGVPGETSVVPALAQALQGDPSRLRHAAIRALGAIGGPEALATLDTVARTHPDPDTRRRAEAEAQVVARRSLRSASAPHPHPHPQSGASPDRP